MQRVTSSEPFAVAAPRTRPEVPPLRPGPIRRHPSSHAMHEIVFLLVALTGIGLLGYLVTILTPHVFHNIGLVMLDRKSTRLNSSHLVISYAVFCLKKKK